MKRILIILLTIFSYVVSAYAQSFEVDGLSYNVTKQPGDESPGEVRVTGGEIRIEIEIPESVTYNEVTYTVTSIGNGAFSGRYDLGNCTKKYIIPGTVRSIGENAFYDNYYLEEVEFNEGLQTIGASAFGYNFLLKEIRIPSTVTSIGNNTFITNQQNRATISCLAETPPSIQSSSFGGRTEATLHVMASCADSYNEAENWKDFSEISDDIIFTQRCYAPKFSLDNNLLTVSCKTEGATIYYTTDGTVPNENGIRYTSPISYSNSQIIRAIAIAEGMENSAIRTFCDREQIETVTDEQGVQYTLEQADDGSFYYSVTGHTNEMNAEIVIPDNLGGCPVKIIKEWVFNSCGSLSSITIPESVTSIGDNAFNNCSGLKIVTSEIPTPFDVNAFSRFDASLVVPQGSRADYKKANGWNFAFTYEKGETIYDKTQTDEQGVQYTLGQADNGSFYYTVTGHSDELKTEVVIPNNLGGCPVKIIKEWVFNNCTSLSSITIPESVTNIGDNAFYNCSGLKMVTSEISTPFDVNAFWSCLNATLVVPQGSRADYKKANGWNFAFTYEEGETIYDRTQTDGQGLCYTLKEADDFSVYYSVTGHSDEVNTEIIIPADLNGCPVKTIEDGYKNSEGSTWDKYYVYHGLFSDCTDLIAVTISNSLTHIGSCAFGGCSSLASVTLGNQLIAIGEDAFGSCTSLSSITIPNSVTTIGTRAFGKCSNLTSVTLGNELKTIEAYAFDGCTSLTSIIIPNSVTNIDVFAFKGCSGLNSVTIGNGVTNLKGGTFSGCTALTSITIPNSVTSIDDYADGYAYYYGITYGGYYGVFDGCSSLSSVTIPNSVTSIGDNSFYGCSSLSSFTIPNSVTSIGDNSFYGCSSLPSVTIPNSVTRLGNGAFSGCRNLVSAKIGNGVTSIADNVFCVCENLSSIKMGNSVSRIGNAAFAGCGSLTSITLPNTLESIGVNAFGGCSLTSINIPGSVKTIDNSAFYGCRSLISVSLEDGLYSIGDDAFRDCALVSITIPNSVKNIGERAFEDNNKLNNVTLGNGITEIKSGLFSNCSSLTSIVIPDGVTNMANGVFANCYSFTSVKLPESLTSMGENVFAGCPLKSVELPNLFTVIPDNLFQYNNSLQYIKLGNNVKSIGKNAFGSREPVIEIGTSTPPTLNKDAFPNVEFLEDVNVIVPNAAAETAYRKAAVWEDMTFSNQNNVSEVTVDTPGDLSWELYEECGMQAAKVVNLKVNGTINADDFTQMLVNMKSLLYLDLSDCDITSIPDNAMKGKTQLQELTLPTSLQTIGSNAFRDCPYLTGELTLPSTLTSIGESAFMGTDYTSVKLSNALKTIGDNAFNNVPISQRLVLPGKVTSVGAGAFAGTQITGLVIPDGVKTIGNNAFADTPIQGHVTIPDGVKTLGDGAFRNTQISTVFLPNSVTTLSQGLFQGCPNLNLVYVPDNYTAMNSSVFDGCESLNILRLSANTETMGSYSLQNTPLEYIKIPSKVETLPTGVLRNCTKLESLALPAELKTVEGEALYGCTALRNMSVEATTPPVIKNRSAIRGINTDKCLISIPTSAYRAYVLAEYWGQFVQMRNDIAVETEGDGEIAFESVEEDEDDEEEVSEAREFGPRRASARTMRRASQLATDDESMTYANNGSSVYVPQQGQVRFYILPAEGEQILSATLDGVDIMPYIVDGVYVATADKKNAKLVVKFSGTGGSSVIAGDVNGDGKVNITDAVGIVNYLLGNPSDGFIEAAADVNNDGSITITDAVAVVNMILESGNSVRELMPLLNNEMIPE